MLPLTYLECRTRFTRRCAAAGVPVTPWPISAKGPSGEELAIDTAWVGPADATDVLVVLSGVHGVEGYIGSHLQTDLVGRIDQVPDGVGLLVVHAVNPWGMAWWRRQNESNVDLNRNWRRGDTEPVHNDAYDLVHPIACPDTDDLPPVEPLLVAAMELVERKGAAWVRDAVTTGQYRHPDGLHFGGDRTEQSNLILEHVVATHLGSAERVLVVDLHTGHGPWGQVTALSDEPPGSTQDRVLGAIVGPDRVEATVDNPGATTGTKSGQIANGFRQELPAATVIASSVEFGTAGDEEQLLATYAEQWVHRRGDRTRPEHAAAVWTYRSCFTPDSDEWVETCAEQGRQVLDAALAFVADWNEADRTRRL